MIRLKKLFCLALMIATFPALNAWDRNYTREEMEAYVEQQRRARPDYKEPPYQAANNLMRGGAPFSTKTEHLSLSLKII